MWISLPYETWRRLDEIAQSTSWPLGVVMAAVIVGGMRIAETPCREVKRVNYNQDLYEHEKARAVKAEAELRLARMVVAVAENYRKCEEREPEDAPRQIIWEHDIEVLANRLDSEIFALRAAYPK